jgi:hypothetical protein
MGNKKIIPNQTESKSYSLKFIGTTFQRRIVFIAKKSTPAENQPGEQVCACTFEKKKYISFAFGIMSHISTWR